jgi:hypothetical protein
VPVQSISPFVTTTREKDPVLNNLQLNAKLLMLFSGKALAVIVLVEFILLAISIKACLSEEPNYDSAMCTGHAAHLVSMVFIVFNWIVTLIALTLLYSQSHTGIAKIHFIFCGITAAVVVAMLIGGISLLYFCFIIVSGVKVWFARQLFHDIKLQHPMVEESERPAAARSANQVPVPMTETQAHRNH